MDALVPRVIGITEATRDKKKPSPSRKGKTNRVEFLAGCSPPVASFFERVLDLAEERGYTIRWGKESFSVRGYLPRAQYGVTFCYGWPSQAFSFYFGHLSLPAEEAQALRRELMEFGVFRESGEKTLTVGLNSRTLPKMPEVYDFVLDKMDDIMKRY